MLEQDQCELLDFLRGKRPAGDFIALFDRDDIPEAVRDTLRRAAPMIAKGARPQTSPLPLTANPHGEPVRLRGLREGGVRDTNQEAQKKVYADPAFRNAVPLGPQESDRLQRLGSIVVHEVKNPALKHLEGNRSPRSPSLQARMASMPSSTWCWPTISRSSSPSHRGTPARTACASSSTTSRS